MYGSRVLDTAFRIKIIEYYTVTNSTCVYAYKLYMYNYMANYT